MAETKTPPRQTTAQKTPPKQTTPTTKKQPQQQTKVVKRTTPTGKTPNFSWPLTGSLLAKYGQTGKGRHNDGIDISASKGTAVKATASGTIVYAGKELEGFGKLVLMKHDNGWVSAYAHLDEITAPKDKWLTKGTKIATVGTSGNVPSPRLHFELRQGTKAVDPLKYLKK